jgi:hypothetical protein
LRSAQAATNKASGEAVQRSTRQDEDCVKIDGAGIDGVKIDGIRIDGARIDGIRIDGRGKVAIGPFS